MSEFVSRAELLADLGRYQEAAEELAAAGPEDVAAQALLAQVKLAAGAPREALAAADAALAVHPADRAAQVARGMALVELGRVDEAATQAEQIRQQAGSDGEAYTSVAAILGAVRTGQAALDAAWEGVRRSPEQPRSHLVLGLVAARLELTDVADRAYQEALALDPALPDPATAVGLVRQEQHRYAVALARRLGRPLPAGEPSAEGAPDPMAGLRRMFRAITDRFRG